MIDEETNVCAAVDPAEPEKALAAAAAASITISIVLTTHHHKVVSKSILLDIRLKNWCPRTMQVATIIWRMLYQV